jgi:D-cysteine desulfhydrase
VPVLSPSDLDAIPRLGWVQAPTPITSLPALAAGLGLEFFGVKRDDLVEALHGGSKPRKLDYLLAAPPFADAPVWAGVGGIGSGALVALTAAAAVLERRLEANVFWTTVSAGVVDNLAFTASGPTEVRFYPSRIAIAVRRPALFGVGGGGRAVVAPGATSAIGMIGAVRAGLELCAQIRAGELPEPDRIYVALGSGGTAAGLSVGLALGGSRATVAAIAVVERILSTRARLRGLQREVTAALARAGIPAPAELPEVVVDHAHLGRGYAEPTAEAIAACESLATEGIELEPVYTGKAMAALGADARRLPLRRVILWQTARRSPLPHDADWRSRLPPALARALGDPAAFGKRIGRRRVLWTFGAAAAAGVLARISGYPPLPGWHGEVLAAWEAQVVTAAAEALLPPAATVEELGSIAARVDRYLVGMPRRVQREAHGMLIFVEHGTALARHASRFTHLPVAAREAFLADLEARGGTPSQAYRALRDLCMLALYQQPSSWAALGYEGPRQPLGYDPHGPDRWPWPTYDALVAPAGTLPRGAAR